MAKKYLDQTIYFILAILLCLMTLDIFVQVFFRYVLNNPLPWPEEVAGILLVWLSYLGIYIALKEKRHIGVNLLVNKLPENVQFYIKIFTKILVFIYLLVVIKEGIQFSSKFMSIKMPYTEVSLGGLVYSVFPISGILMLIQVIFDLAEEFKTDRIRLANYRRHKHGSSFDF